MSTPSSQSSSPNACALLAAKMPQAASATASRVSEGSILEAFDLFPKLATELQLTIWEFAIPEPRIIAIKISSPDTVYEKGFIYETAQELTQSLENAANNLVLSSDSEVPSLLSACKSSREVILRTYEAQIPLSDRALLRFDGNQDTILLYHDVKSVPFLPGYEMAPIDYPNYRSIFSNVKNIALHITYFMDVEKDETVWALSHFKSLVNIIPLNFCMRKDILQLPASQCHFRLLDFDRIVAPLVSTSKACSASPNGQDHFMADFEEAFTKHKRSRSGY